MKIRGHYYGILLTGMVLIGVVACWNRAGGQDKKIGYRGGESQSSPGDEGIVVATPGVYDQPGATYKLSRDISSAGSAVFLGKDVTLDLNGHTISYADGPYEHLPNMGFEEGLKGWDVSEAPGAEVLRTRTSRPFIGEHLLSLEAGDEIVSEYITFPEARRSYFAMVGITGRLYEDMDGDLDNDMRISIYVEDESGREVRLNTEYSDTTMMSVPVEHRSPRLGGGVIYAHLNNLPVGKYRVRVRAETDCLVDQIDIRPAMDVGIGIVGETHPVGHYDHMYENRHSAFFDYTKDVSEGTPLDSIPRVEGKGTVTIKNGVIKSGAHGVLSWGIQSTAEEVRVILDNVKIVTSGINAVAVDVPHATITQSTFRVDNPFIINRHGSQFYAVDLRGDRASEVSFSAFYGGQGCLVFKGEHSIVHNNFFENHQKVTNHYSIMAMGDGSQIFENVFKPKIGSGIEIFRHRDIEIFNNRFEITAAPRSTEYHYRYSTNGIRIADYGAAKGSPRGAYGNKVYNNSFVIRGKKYHEFPDYIPVASAVFYSGSAGEDHFFGNDIFVEQRDPGTDAEAHAFYIGNADGGKFYNNTIRSNVSPVWIGVNYGNAANIDFYQNQFIKIPESAADFTPVRIGASEGDNTAERITLRSNTFRDLEFNVDVDAGDEATPRYSVSWTLEVTVQDSRGNPVSGEVVTITDNSGTEVYSGSTDEEGSVETELTAYSADRSGKIRSSPYTVNVRDLQREIALTQNRKISFEIL